MSNMLRCVCSEGFRVFFLSAGAFSVFAGLVWLLYLGVHFTGGMMTGLPFAPPPHLWHGHEMIFGYASAAIAGFLLTAVPNWTGAAPVRPRLVCLTAGLWLAGRLAIWFSGTLPAWLVAAADLALLPVMAGLVGAMLMQRPKPQNVMFLLFLLAIWSGNLLVHLEWIGLSDDSAAAGLRGGLIGLTSMIAVLGGRVTPAFTRNAMNRAGLSGAGLPVSYPPLEKATLVLALALPLTVLAGLPDLITGLLAILSGAVQLARLSKWRGRWTLRQPILLALHLGMAMLGLGLILWGLAQLGLGSEIAALHVLGIGAVGGMSLAVMSRAALGHTGRPLIAPEPIAIGYLLVALSAVLRWVGSEFSGEWYFPLILASGVLWVLAFALYTVTLLPMVTAPRLSEEP